MARRDILFTIIAHRSAPVEDLAALGEIDRGLASALVEQEEGNPDPYKIIERCDCPEFFECLLRRGKLAPFTAEVAPKVVPRASKKSGEKARPAPEVGQLFVYALSKSRLGVARWIKNHFSLGETALNAAMYDAAYRGDTKVMRWLWKSFDVNWEHLRAKADDPFWAAFVENHASAAEWLADNIYPNQSLEGRWSFFADLFALNNLPAVRWLLERYPVGIDSLFKPGADIGVLLYGMAASGRADMADYLSRRYGVSPKVGKVEDAGLLGLGRPPPARPQGYDALVALRR